MALVPDSSAIRIGPGLWQVINYFVAGFGFLVASGFMMILSAMDRGLYFECVLAGGLKHGPAAAYPTAVTHPDGRCYSIARLSSGGEEYLHKDVADEADVIYWLMLAAGATAIFNFLIRWWLLRNDNQQNLMGGPMMTKDILEVVLAAFTVGATATVFHLSQDLLNRSHESYKYFPVSTDVTGSITEEDWDAMVEKDTAFTLIVVSLSFFSLNLLWKLLNLIGIFQSR